MDEIDREKVIETLKVRIISDTDAGYSTIEIPVNEAERILALLKEQEPKSVYWRLGRAHCPSCGELFPKKQDKQYIRFCNWCGQAVKWDD